MEQRAAMYIFDRERIAKAAAEAGIADLEVAVCIMQMVVELKRDDTIYCELLTEFGPDRYDAGTPAQINSLIRSYILNNHLKEFIDYREKNSITVFDENLCVRTEYYHTARILLAVFLREALRADSMAKSSDDRLGYPLQ